MKCGIAIPHYGRAAQPSMVEDLAREAEALGFDSVWASDHVLLPVEGAGVPHYFYDALIVMAAAAAVTTRLRIGTSVLVIPYRDPRLLASVLATLDQMSKGRVILGAGAGGLEGEFAGLGIDFHQRGALTNEYLDCMQALWTTDPTSFHGRWIHFDEMRSNPKPFQNPLPIWIGGHSDAAVQRAAVRGTGWQPSNMPLDDFRVRAKAYRDACVAAGRPPGPICLRSIPRGPVQTADDRIPFTGDPADIARAMEAYAEAGLTYVVFSPQVRSKEELQTEMQYLAQSILPLLPQ